MQYTPNYNLITVEGTDVVNPLVQMNPNFTDIDAAMFANKQASIGSATELTSGTVHSITRANPDSNYFRFTATGDWTSGDSMSVDGVTVSVYLSDGSAPLTGAYVINSEVFAIIAGSRVTLLTSAGVSSNAIDVSYNNSVSGLAANNVQAAIDEVSAASEHGLYEIWNNLSPTNIFAAQNLQIFTDKVFDAVFIEYVSANGVSEALVMVEPGNTSKARDMYISGSGILNEYERSATLGVITGGYQIAFNDASHMTLNTYGSTPATSTDNNYLIPKRILGLLHNN